MTKICFKCLRRKSIDQFYRHAKMADGHLGKCKKCTRSDVKANNKRDPLARRAYEKARFQTEERKNAALKYQKDLRAREPGKYRARTAVSNALRDGRLTKQPCKCGATKVQAHHHDYRKPLDVEWLCFKCHREDRHGQHVPDATP